LLNWVPDRYPNHAFIVLSLQKLVHLVDLDQMSDDDASIRTSKSTYTLFNKIKNLFGKGHSVADVEDSMPKAANRSAYMNSHPTGFSDVPDVSTMRSLQRYHASPNEARTEFMEKHSSLAERNLGISAEQVAIFLTSDNTVISFFELSADDVEEPIVRRLNTSGTILRQSCDASLLVQAIIDAIIDLAIPLTAVYSDVIGDLELDVLTSPNIKQCRSLYIIISEINKMLSFLNPIDNLVNVLRDHKTSMPHDQAINELQNPETGVIVTPMTNTYLGDVLDHCVIITEALQQIKQSSDNLINLIFNTISAQQNESMTQLTTATIVFLPMTFITGYFGMNFQPFDVLLLDVPYL
jgi:Mg2+ and Co2+ transporter CorA